MLALGMLAVLLPASPDGLVAQTDPVLPDSLPRYILEGVTVSSRRTPALRADLPQKVEVITSADLERTVADDLAEALKETAGLDVIQYPALLAGVSVRGFRPQFSGIAPRTLILLDGRPAGTANLGTIDLAVVERIEVLKGPASALFGSSAMGGVVNLITRRSTGEISGHASGSYGSFGTYRGELLAGGRLSSGLDFDLVLSGAGRSGGYEVGGARLLGGETVTKLLTDGTVSELPEIEPDTAITFSDYETRAGSIRLGYALGEAWRADARLGYFEGEDVQNPGDLIAGWGQTLNDLERRTAEASLSGSVGAHSVSARVFGSREVTDYYDDAFDPSFVSFRLPTLWSGAQLQDVMTLGVHTLTVGLDHTRARTASERFVEEGVEAPPYSPDSEVRSTAAFAEARAEALGGRLVATVGGRLDRVDFRVEEGSVWDFATWSEAVVAGTSESHTVLNPSAGLMYAIGGGARAHASTGRAFVTPDAFFVAGYSEVRLPGRAAVSVTQGNPDLDPESSVSWDAGISFFRPALGIDADLTYFSTDVDDRIVARPLALTGTTLTAGGDTVVAARSYENADRAEIRGLEGRISYDLGALADYRYSLRLFATGTRLLRAEEISGGEARRIRNVADLTLVGGIDYDDARRFGARLAARYVGERQDTDFVDWMNPGEVLYPEFLVVDASGRLRLLDRLTLSLEMNNLLDENYYEVRGYNLPGRSLRLGAGISF